MSMNVCRQITPRDTALKDPTTGKIQWDLKSIYKHIVLTLQRTIGNITRPKNNTQLTIALLEAENGSLSGCQGPCASSIRTGTRFKGSTLRGFNTNHSSRLHRLPTCVRRSPEVQRVDTRNIVQWKLLEKWEEHAKYRNWMIQLRFLTA